jgi:hypothetical protein
MAGGREYSSYQKKIINRYYDHLDTITLGKLAEAVGELFLLSKPAPPEPGAAPEAVAEAEKIRLRAIERQWKSVEKALAKTAAKDARVNPILASRDVAKLADLVNELSGRGASGSGGVMKAR